jgi:hypothetical protein
MQGYIQSLKDAYGYNELEFNANSFLPGFRFDLSELSSEVGTLDGYQVIANRVRSLDVKWVIRNLVLRNDVSQGTCKVLIIVVQDRSQDVGEALFQSYLNTSGPANMYRVFNELGDFRYYRGPESDPHGIDFARSNVAVRLARKGGPLDLRELAFKIDEALGTEPEPSVDQTNEVPKVTIELPPGPPIPTVRPGGVLPLGYTVNVPDGGRYEIEWEATGGSVNLNTEDPKPDYPYYYRATREPGNHSITLRAISDRNLLGYTVQEIKVGIQGH